MSLFMLIAFSVLCAGLYYVCPLRFRWMLLLAVSYAYYAYCDLAAVPFLLLTTLSTWAGALAVARVGERCSERAATAASREEKKRLRLRARRVQRALLLAVLLVGFGALGVFKYLDSLLALFSRPGLSLLLPLGISFYTFQSAGYLLDVYNGKLAPERNPARFALFVSFFPQLMQGPIARYGQLAAQLCEPHRFDPDAVERAALLMVWGFFKKKVLADRAMLAVEAVFDAPGRWGGAMAVAGVLLYSLQQYCDFSGGIDLAAGIAELFGVRLAPNFRRPYFAVSLGDFWRRWHISLGAWMRDYVFYPFALTRPVVRLSKAVGRRSKALARALPAMLGNVLVFLLVGLWHGATANYILWGLYNGVLLALSALLEPAYKRFGDAHRRLAASRGFHVLRVLRTFVIVNIGWFFDRCARAGDALAMLRSVVFSPCFSQLSQGLMKIGLTDRDWQFLTVGALLLFAVSFAQERGAHVRAWTLSRPLPLRWALLLAFFMFVLTAFTMGGAYDSGFLYAAF